MTPLSTPYMEEEKFTPVVQDEYINEEWLKLFGIDFCCIWKAYIGFHSVCSLIIYSIGKFFYDIIFNIVYYWLRHGPTYFFWIPMGGYQGLPEEEICSKIMTTTSFNYRKGTGKDLCLEIIEQTITGRVTFLLGIFTALFIILSYYHLPEFIRWLYNWWNYEEIKKRRETQTQNRKTTLKKNEMYKMIVNQVASLVKPNTTEVLSVVVGIRNIFDGMERGARQLGENYITTIAAKEILNDIVWPSNEQWILRLGRNNNAILDHIENTIMINRINSDSDSENSTQ